MIKTRLMRRLKDKFGGNYAKEDGRWFWSKGKEKHLVTTGWLIRKLEQPKVEAKQETKIEVKEEVKQVKKSMSFNEIKRSITNKKTESNKSEPVEELKEEKINEPKSTD